MLKRSLKILAGIIGATAVMFAFQNCGESLDLSQADQALELPASGVSFGLHADAINNRNHEITLSITELIGYTVAWEKDGALLIDETGESLSFMPITFADAGDYEAIVTDADANEYRSGIMTLVVLPNPDIQTLDNPSFTFNGQTHFMVNLAQVTLPAVAADTFCKAKLGAQAALVSHELNAASTFTTYYAYATTQVQCNGNSLALTFQNGFCLAYYAPGFNLFQFNNIVCNPNI